MIGIGWLLVYLLIFVVVVGVAFYVLAMLPIPQPWMNIARAIFALIVLLIVLSYVLPLGGGSHHHLLLN